MDKSSRLSKIKARLTHAQDILKKAEGVLEAVESKRDENFGDAEMLKHAKKAAEGLNLGSLDELRAMKMQPPPVVEIIARCVCTLASGDDLGDAEYRAKEKAAKAAAEKAAQIAISKGIAPPKPPVMVRRRLLSWEESCRVLARSNFKDKIAHFDGRLLLDNDDLVAEVRSRIDLSSITPEKTMAENLKPPVKTQREKNEEAANNQRRREGYAEAIKAGGVEAAPMITLEDARYVSRIGPPLLVWIARVLAQHDELEPEWKAVNSEVRVAARKRDEAKDSVDVVKHKADEAREDEARKRQKAKEEKERAEAMGLALEEEQKQHTKGDDRPKELVKPGQIVISGPTPNIFFQNGRISAIAGPGCEREGGQLSPRKQLPTVIRFFIRVKHCRVSWPFPPSIPADKYLLTAQVIEGHQEAGPVAHVQFDPAHVIGLLDHQLLSFVQLVIEVPSTETINPTIHSARLSFHPRHGSQLHSCGAGGAGTIEMPRLIITVYPHLISRHAAQAAASSAPASRVGSPEASTAAATTSSPLGGLGKSRKGSPSLSSPDKITTVSVPLLPMEMTRSIGSAYRLSQGKMASSKGGRVSAKGHAGGDANWARAEIALTERARSRPFALSKPGPARQIPDILLQNSAVSIASARRLSRSSARMGVEPLKELAALTLRACEGYVLSKVEKRQLRRAAELEAEVEAADRLAEENQKSEANQPASTESALSLAIKAAEEEAQRKARIEQARLEAAGLAQPQPPQEEEGDVATEAAPATSLPPTTPTADAIVAEMAAMSMEEEARLAKEREDGAQPEVVSAAALAEAEAAAHADNLPDAAAFNTLFAGSDEIEHAATVAAHAAISGAPAAADAVVDAFAAAVQFSAAALAPATAQPISPARPASPRGGGKGKAGADGNKPASPGKSPRRMPPSDARQVAAKERSLRSSPSNKPASPRSSGGAKGAKTPALSVAAAPAPAASS